MAIAYKHYPGMEVLSCTDAFAFKPHIHDRYVVWLNTGCGEHYSLKGETDILQPGTISIFEPGLVHANHPCAADKRHLCSFYVEPFFFEDLAMQCSDGGSAAFGFERKTVKDRELWACLARLHQSFFSESRNTDLDSGVVETFTSLVLRHGGARLKELPGKGCRSFSDTCDSRVNQAIDYFHANLDQEIRLKALAENLGCTQFHLIRLFRTHKGLSPHAFLLQIRLEHARTSLGKGLPISRISAAAGFSDQSHLTRAFKARYGITPRAYQKACS